MEKLIYDGPDIGFWGFDTFRNFIRREFKIDKKGVIRENVKREAEDLYFVYYFSPQDVTLHYNIIKKGVSSMAEIILFGDEDGIGEVEKIITSR